VSTKICPILYLSKHCKPYFPIKRRQTMRYEQLQTFVMSQVPNVFSYLICLQGCRQSGAKGPLQFLRFILSTVHCILRVEYPNIFIYALNNIPAPPPHTYKLVYTPGLVIPIPYVQVLTVQSFRIHHYTYPEQKTILLCKSARHPQGCFSKIILT